MEQFHIAQRNMAESLVEFFADRSALRLKNPAVEESYQWLKSEVPRVVELGRLQGQVITGVAAHKAALRARLCRAIIACSSPLAAFSEKESNPILGHRFKLSPSALERLPDNDLRDVGQTTVEAVNEHEASLAHFGFTADDKVTLIAAQNAWVEEIASPRRALTERTITTAEVEDALAAVTTHIRNQLDPLMLQYWAKDPSTYEAYRKNRRLYGLPRYEQEDSAAAEPTPQPASISGSGQAVNAPALEPVAARLDRENRSIFESVLPPSEELYGGAGITNGSAAPPISPPSRSSAANGNGSTHAVELGG